jgi:hypothetical protein
MAEETSEVSISEDTLTLIQNNVLEAEEEQLSYRKPHNIIPEIEQIIEDEIQPSDVPKDSDQ